MSVRSEVRARIRGLYGLADAEASGGDPVRLGAQLLEGGCRLVQLRCKGWADGDVLLAARDLRSRCHAVGATFLVNDHPEIARSAAADGVHVGQTDADALFARRVLGPDRIIGVSTNDPEQAAAAAAVGDYVAFGPLGSTEHLSRPKTVRGLDGLRAVRAAIGLELPLVGIGGITAERLPAVIAAGADAWAVIGAVAGAEDPVAATRGLVGPR